ncbi:hypothetical protein AAF712_005540 [Marasmius tenuissimus]|uniref:Uncharacterized protein n=1 Tax=Marasmius tenuissimus TaxID=585030 RepID=A0ABR3A2R2_9AGAR
MSSLDSKGWRRKLRSGKEFSPIVIEDLDISRLLWDAAARQVEGESGVKTPGSAVEEACDMVDVDFTLLKNNTKKHVGKKRKAREDDDGGRGPEESKRHRKVTPIDDGGQSHTNRKRCRKRARLADLVGRASKNPCFIASPVSTAFNSTSLPSKGDGYSAKVTSSKEMEDGSREFSVDELVTEKGFDLVKWDGTEHKTITDPSSTVLVALVTPPDDPTFKEKCLVFHSAILSKREQFEEADATQQRGNFPAVRQGITYGMGQDVPMRVVDRKYANIMEELLSTKEAARISGYQSASYARFSPKNYEYYSETKRLIRKYPRTKHLRWNFECSVFASAAINFGPRTCTFKHRDIQNLPHGWCAVTAMGNYDYRKGGHLVLWDLKLVIQFPPGCTILLPSASLLHSNIPVQPGETRTSYTQYSAGALFRWVNHGGRNLTELKAQDRNAFNAHGAGLKAKAGLAGVERLSTLDELVAQGHLVR